MAALDLLICKMNIVLGVLDPSLPVWKLASARTKCLLAVFEAVGDETVSLEGVSQLVNSLIESLHKKKRVAKK